MSKVCTHTHTYTYYLSGRAAVRPPEYNNEDAVADPYISSLSLHTYSSKRGPPDATNRRYDLVRLRTPAISSWVSVSPPATMRATYVGVFQTCCVVSCAAALEGGPPGRPLGAPPEPVDGGVGLSFGAFAPP